MADEKKKDDGDANAKMRNWEQRIITEMEGIDIFCCSELH